MTRRFALFSLVLVLATVPLAGCALPGADESASTEPAESATPPQETGEPAVPEGDQAEAAAAAIGEPAEAGPWTFVVTEAEYGESFGDLSVASGSLLKVEADLANSSAGDLKVSPTDFMLSDGTAYTLPMETGPELTPEALVPAGGTEDVSMVFNVPEDRSDVPLTLIFQPAEGDAVSIRVTIR